MSLLSIIPSDRIAAVEAALQQGLQGQTVTEIMPLAGGLSTSSVYKIIANGHPYVLKLDAPVSNTSISGAGNPRLAADAGIAPPLFHQDKVTGISISGYINNTPVRSSFAPDKLAVELARTIRKAHDIPCPGGGNDLLSIIDGLIAIFKQSGILNGPVFDECFTHFGAVRSKYPWSDKDQVFSHNDLNPNNILCDGERIWIIDWDMASVNDRYIDLANAANYFIHTPAHEQLFLGTYFDGPPNERQLSRFFIMRQLCRIIYAMLMFQLAARHKPAGYVHDQEMEGITVSAFGALRSIGQISLASYEGQFMYGKALVNEAVAQMRSARFAEALARLA